MCGKEENSWSVDQKLHKAWMARCGTFAAVQPSRSLQSHDPTKCQRLPASAACCVQKYAG